MNSLSFTRKCPGCSKEVEYKTVNSLRSAISKNSKCRSCSSSKPDHIKLFNRFKKSAEERGKDFNLTEEYLLGLLHGSQYRCCYTGEELSFNEISIDRIDSNIGYLMGNVQIVHKMINQMKYVYPDVAFVEKCNMISNHKTHLANVAR